MSDLSGEGVDFKYFKIDDKTSGDFIHDRMSASGISTRRYNLPVIDVNGEILVRPELFDVISRYNEKL